MSQLHRSAARPPGRLTEGSLPALRLLEDVHVRLAEGLRHAPEGPQAVWGPDHKDSSDPSARRLRANARSFEWVAVTFPGWSLWHIHLGLVPRGPGVLALGVHWHDAMAHLLPAAVADLAASGIATHYDEESGEHQADFLVLAYSFCPRAVQILSDAALDLAHLLDVPLAVDPTVAPPKTQGAVS